MKKGLVFAGGGSKGAYQIGAWKALEELGERFDVATGTSIGSINAMLYVQNGFDAAYEMWQRVRAENIMTHGVNLDRSVEAMYKQREQLFPFIKNYVASKGADVRPFHEILSRHFDPDRFFSSPIDYALITVKFPSFTPVEKTKRDLLPYGANAWQWLAASGAAFPVFPVMKIDGEDYVDGGYYDNIPIASAFKLGAEEVVVLDLKTEKNHEGYVHHPRVRYIKPTRDLGTFLNFDRKALDFSISLGYYDTMKSYGVLLGDDFTFSYPLERLSQLKEISRGFLTLLTVSEARFDFSKSVKLHRVNKLHGSTTILSQRLEEDHPDDTDLFLSALEGMMDCLGYLPGEVYDLQELFFRLKVEADSLYPMLDQGSAEEIFARVRGFVQARAPEKNPYIKRLEEDRWLLILTSLLQTLQRAGNSAL